ncbi:conjugal transfer protein TraX [Pseudoflavonifractor sp. DSM 107456]|uniref:Conjugal transfer protein TraX n=1 Tax=Pseudoflavonifractor gallinarum TaxID=2779352 RepID=A0ABR9RBE1_9FIRM|nr:TraX family protein [Pseudoflavonifractor gallinarum]MBE5055873.1 conjugal transfer protein TraX [Pseudoflavonifractor gallinarum]MBS5136643.1 conjugal transfer protein TraX [Oscillospiraceae bacterium]
MSALERSGGLSGTQLKYLAALFMVIDHVGMFFEPMAPFFPPDSLWFYLFRYVGRLAFPIFAFFVAEGCRKTRHYAAYLRRLFCFAALTQIPLYFVMPEDGRSVITTFFLASLAIGLYRHFQEKGYPVLGILLGGVCVFLAQPLHGDYGWIGCLTVVILYFCGEDRARQLRMLALCLLCYYLAGSLWAYWGVPTLSILPTEGWARFLVDMGGRLPYFQRFYLPYSLLMSAFACLSLVPLSRYNGKRGNGSRWFFYWFYPGHLVLLAGLSALLS